MAKSKLKIKVDLIPPALQGGGLLSTDPRALNVKNNFVWDEQQLKAGKLDKVIVVSATHAEASRGIETGHIKLSDPEYQNLMKAGDLDPRDRIETLRAFERTHSSMSPMALCRAQAVLAAPILHLPIIGHLYSTRVVLYGDNSTDLSDLLLLGAGRTFMAPCHLSTSHDPNTIWWREDERTHEVTQRLGHSPQGPQRLIMETVDLGKGATMFYDMAAAQERPVRMVVMYWSHVPVNPTALSDMCEEVAEAYGVTNCLPVQIYGDDFLQGLVSHQQAAARCWVYFDYLTAGPI